MNIAQDLKKGDEQDRKLYKMLEQNFYPNSWKDAAVMQKVALATYFIGLWVLFTEVAFIH